jgi:hypothetical protein
MKMIDSYRFLDFASRQVMKAWADRQEPGVIPFTPLAKPLSECAVAATDRRAAEEEAVAAGRTLQRPDPTERKLMIRHAASS